MISAKPEPLRIQTGITLSISQLKTRFWRKLATNLSCTRQRVSAEMRMFLLLNPFSSIQ